MPAEDLIDTDTVHKLFVKFPPENDREKLYKSLFITMSQRADAAENALRKLRREVIASVAELLKQMGKGGEEPATAEQSAAQEPQVGAPGDKTPFPEGFKWKADGPPPATAAAPAKEVPTPDVVSGPATNTQPIPPQAAPTKNGSRGKQA